MVKYWYHDGSVFLLPQYATPAGLAQMFREAGKAAREAMASAGAAHAIYGTKSYDRETGALVEADVYLPPVVLSEEEFERRTRDHLADHPSDLILAVHAMA